MSTVENLDQRDLSQMVAGEFWADCYSDDRSVAVADSHGWPPIYAGHWCTIEGGCPRTLAGWTHCPEEATHLIGITIIVKKINKNIKASIKRRDTKEDTSWPRWQISSGESPFAGDSLRGCFSSRNVRGCFRAMSLPIRLRNLRRDPFQSDRPNRRLIEA